jgi:hypothetical protein
MYKELKKAILEWLLTNENKWQRLNKCKEHFRQYIYDDKGKYIIGGLNTATFIENADKLLYGGMENDKK